MTFTIDTERRVRLSPYIFGHNLEHTRSAVGGSGGLSAQMLRNRKFAGKPGKNSGVAAEWRGIGDRAFFQNGGRDCYTRHIGCERMVRRNELQSQSVQNVHGGLCGLAQRDLAVRAGEQYEIRSVTRVSAPVTLAAELTDRSGKTVYARAEYSLVPGDWETCEVVLSPDRDDEEAALHDLTIINDLIRALHRWYRDALPESQVISYTLSTEPASQMMPFGDTFTSSVPIRPVTEKWNTA